MTKLDKFLIGLLMVQAMVALNLILPAQIRTQPVAANTAFNHDQCQYPDRTTNPPDGCDNSDPCDPANVKGGSGDCLPIPEPITPIVTPAQPQVAQCGGK